MVGGRGAHWSEKNGWGGGEMPGQGVDFSKGPGRPPSLGTDSHGYLLVGIPAEGPWALNDPRSAAAFLLTDVPAAAAPPQELTAALGSVALRLKYGGKGIPDTKHDCHACFSTSGQ